MSLEISQTIVQFLFKIPGMDILMMASFYLIFLPFGLFLGLLQTMFQTIGDKLELLKPLMDALTNIVNLIIYMIW